MAADLTPIAAHIATAGSRRRVFDPSTLDIAAPWSGNVSELNLLLRAPMEHIGLGGLDVFVELFEGDEKVRGLPDEVDTRPAFCPAVWFVEITEGLCIFAGEAVACAHLARVLPDVAGAVSAAFAAHAGLNGPSGWSAATLRDGAVALGLVPLLKA